MNRTLLFVINHAGFFLSHRLPLASAARERGWDVHIATPESKHVPEIIESRFPWHEIRLTRSGMNLIEELRLLGDLRRLYREIAPGIVHHVTTKPVLWGTIAARKERVPAVVNALTGLGHLSMAEDLFHRSVRQVLRAGFRFALVHPRMKVIFQNEVDRDTFVGAKLVAPSEAVLIPGSGVDPNVFRPRDTGTASSAVVMLPSRMLVTKGVREFVSAARLLRKDGCEARFVLVGEPDPDNPASIGLDRLRTWEAEGVVEYWGRQSDMPDVYRQADVICLPSYGEGMPKVLIEAGACGLACVTTDIAGCRDVVIDGETGILVPVRDGGVEIARAVSRLLGDHALRSEMGERARKRVLEHYSLDRVLDMTLQLYEELI